MVLGKLPLPGRPTIWIIVEQGPTVLAVGAGGGCLDIFTLIYPFSPLSPSLWEMARYRLKYCLKGPLNPTQPTNVQSSKAIGPVVMEQEEFSTIYGHGGPLGHVTWTKYIYFVLPLSECCIKMTLTSRTHRG